MFLHIKAYWSETPLLDDVLFCKQVLHSLNFVPSSVVP